MIYFLDSEHKTILYFLETLHPNMIGQWKTIIQ